MADTKIGSLAGFNTPTKALQVLHKHYGVDVEHSRQNMKYPREIIQRSTTSTPKGPLQQIESTVFNPSGAQPGKDSGTAVIPESARNWASVASTAQASGGQRVSCTQLLEILSDATTDLLAGALSVDYVEVYHESIDFLQKL